MSVLNVAGMRPMLTVVGASETKLATKTASLNGETVSNLDLLDLQMEMTSNSMTVNLTSQIVHSRDEMYKGVIHNF